MNKKNIVHRRLTQVFILFSLSFILLTAHLVWIQLVQGEELENKASNKRIHSISLAPSRGIIKDSRGNKLVTNISVDSIYAIPKEINNPDKTAQKLSTLLDLDKDTIIKKLTGSNEFQWIARKINFETAQKIKNLKLEGIKSVQESDRFYLNGPMASHLLGFTGIDNQGLLGIEKSYDSTLKGKSGKIIAEFDALGRKIPGTTQQYVKPKQGNNLTLTIDKTIQYYVQKELKKIMQTTNPKLAVGIVMDPQTGKILAMENTPTFNPNHWEKSSKEVWNHNPAAWYNYEPGSTFKIITASAALETNTVSPQDTFYDPGYINVSGERIHCWKNGGHGIQTFEEVVQNSCNPGFVKVALELGKKGFYPYIKDFGFNKSTGIDLPGEEKGIMIPEKEATELNIASMAIGQSIAVTPIQLINGISAAANGGKLMKPYIVEEITTPGGKTVKKFEPHIKRKVISKDTSKIIRSMLEKVVSQGTGKKAYIEGYRVAGKTGTAQVVGDSGYIEGKYVASFAGFAPADNPQVSVLVMIADPEGPRYHGGEIAAPAFKNITENTLRYLDIPRISTSNSGEQKDNLQQSNVTVPGLKNRPVQSAKKILNSLGLRFSTTGEGNIVNSQQPSPNTRVSKGSTINLKLASTTGENEEITVPNLKGLTIKETANTLQNIQLLLDPEGTGLAVKQNIKPGSKVPPETKIKIIFEAPGNQ